MGNSQECEDRSTGSAEKRKLSQGASVASGPVGMDGGGVAADWVLRVTDSSKPLLLECGLGPRGSGLPGRLFEMQSLVPTPLPTLLN